MPPVSHPLSLHDALPISQVRDRERRARHLLRAQLAVPCALREIARLDRDLAQALRMAVAQHRRDEPLVEGHRDADVRPMEHARSEEHTSELQSLTNLVCRPSPTPFPYTTLFRSPRFEIENVAPDISCARSLRFRARSARSRDSIAIWLRLFAWQSRSTGVMSPSSRATAMPTCARWNTRDRKSTRLNSSH